MNFIETRYKIKNKKEKIYIKTKGIKLRQLKTKNDSLKINFYNGFTDFRIKKKGIHLPLGVFFNTKKLGISIHNSERFKKRQRKKKAALEAKKRKKPKLTDVQKSKAKKAAKLKKKLKKLKWK